MKKGELHREAYKCIKVEMFKFATLIEPMDEE
jgi:hypothetical protein